MAGMLTVHADGYSYLTFELTGGEKVSLSVSSLTITVSETTLTAGSQSFTLSNLNKMYFSNTDETTEIKSLTTEEWNGITDIYSLHGQKVLKEQMQDGVYIVKSKNGTFKLVKK